VIKIVELLSPARDFTSLNTAIKNGADSVYLGIEGYNLRAHSRQFKLEDLKSAVQIAHDNDVQLYVCTNTVMKDDDIISLKKIMPEIEASGADAIIASDLGVLSIAREHALKVHMSVQANISNTESLKLLKDLGVSRVILSRELSLDDIRRIKVESPLEIEVFVHGAMCMAISGRCFLSSQLYQKDANCGECIQPCQEKWLLLSEDRANNRFKDDLENSVCKEKLENKSYKEILLDQENDITRILSPKDLCMIEFIPELIQTGIDAFKIEGRARSADYVATVTRTYREAINRYQENMWDFNPEWIRDLKKVFNRGFDTGFYFNKPYQTSGYNEATHTKKDVGAVINYYKKVSAAEIRLWDNLDVGDEIIIEGRTTGSVIQRVESMQIQGKNVNKAYRDEAVAIMVGELVRPNDVVYKRVRKEDE
jgi:putative protease